MVTNHTETRSSDSSFQLSRFSTMFGLLAEMFCRKFHKRKFYWCEIWGAYYLLYFGVPEWKKTTVYCFRARVQVGDRKFRKLACVDHCHHSLWIWMLNNIYNLIISLVCLRAIFKRNLCKYEIDLLTTACVVCSTLFLCLSLSPCVAPDHLVRNYFLRCVNRLQLLTRFLCVLFTFFFSLHIFFFSPRLVRRPTDMCVYIECNRLTFKLKC